MFTIENKQYRVWWRYDTTIEEVYSDKIFGFTRGVATRLLAKIILGYLQVNPYDFNRPADPS